MRDVEALVVVLKYVVVTTFWLRQNMVEVDMYRDSLGHEHVKYGYPRQVAHGTACLQAATSFLTLPHLSCSRRMRRTGMTTLCPIT